MRFTIHYSIDYIKQKVDKEGAVMLRDTHIDTVEKMSEFGKLFGNTNVDMSCSAGPRKSLGRNIFTSNEAPSDKSIPPHHEMAQCENPPSYIIFFCLIPPLHGGCTPIIRSSDVALKFKVMYPDLYKRLKTEGIRYLREFPSETDLTQPLGKSWKETYRVQTRAELEDVLKVRNIDWVWLENDTVQTIGPIMPIFRTDCNDEETIFMAAETSLLYQKSGAKKMLMYANGEHLSKESNDAFIEIGKYAYEHSTRISYCKNDVLIINNSSVMHSRDPFTGPRELAVLLVE